MDHPPPAAVAAAAGGGAAAVNAGCWWQPVVSQGALLRAHIAMAAAAAAFSLFALTLQPATFPHLPAYCDTTAREIMELRFRAWLLLLCAMAQAGAATAALVVAPQSRDGGFFAVVTNLLGLLTVGHIWRLVIRVIFATGGLCITSHLRTAELVLHAVLAHLFATAIPVLWAVGQ